MEYGTHPTQLYCDGASRSTKHKPWRFPYFRRIDGDVVVDEQYGPATGPSNRAMRAEIKRRLADGTMGPTDSIDGADLNTPGLHVPPSVISYRTDEDGDEYSVVSLKCKRCKRPFEMRGETLWAVFTWVERHATAGSGIEAWLNAMPVRSVRQIATRPDELPQWSTN